MKMIYLASPYSHSDEAVRIARFEAVCRAAGEIMRRGEVVFSPIAHTHPIAMLGSLPTDWEYWKRVDSQYLSACDRFWVLMLDGWKQSTGVLAETELAREFGLQPSWHCPSCFGLEK